MMLAFSGALMAAELPTKEAIKQRMAELQPDDGKQLDAVSQSRIEALQQALDNLVAQEQAKAKLDELETRMEQAPGELRELQQALEDKSGEVPSTTLESLEALDLDTLESRLEQASEALARDQDRLAKIESQLLGTQALPERVQKDIAAANQAMEKSRRMQEDLAAQGVDESDPRYIQAQSLRAMADQRMKLYQRELATNSRLRELAQQRRDLLERQVTSQESLVVAMQRLADERRWQRSEEAIAEAVRDEPEGVASHPLVGQEQAANRKMSLELLKVTRRANELAREGQEVKRQLDSVRQLQRGFDEHIEAMRGSPLLAKILREQRQTLPRVDARGGLKEEIADLRLRQFDLDRQRTQLKNIGEAAQQRLEREGIKDAAALEAAMEQLLRARRDLIDQLSSTYGEMLSAAIELQLNQQQLLMTSGSLRDLIDKQLFWVASTRPLDLAWAAKPPSHLMTEWHQGEWRLALPTRWSLPGTGALLALPVLLVAMGLMMTRRMIKRRLLKLHDEIGHLRRDSQGHTPKAILFNAMLALSGPLCLLAGALVLIYGGEGIAIGIGYSLLQISLAWGVVAWARRLLVSDGVAVRHFHWPSAYVAKLRWWLLWLLVFLLPVLLIAPLAKGAFGVELSQRPLALALLMIGFFGMSLVLAKLILAHTPFFGVKLFRLILGLLMAAVPLGLAGLVAFGYAYTALSLVSRFVITLYVLGIWILVEAAVVRGLAVAARRLAYRRALARRRALQESEGDGGLEVVEEPPLDMQQVNQQSLRLARLILLIGFLVVLYLVWTDLLTVFGYLNQVILLDGDGQDGSELVSEAVSVADIVVALLTFGLTLMLARNLPGLLEVMVLSRLELKQGSAYAISSLLSYVIVGTGVVMSLGTLGVSWGKLQWLVAALGVGLGFGLQEIFANFISGLIILFERPVRIGDTITLGNLTGTVNRIRIRATTVTDFDRKEIIIPNKTFVTDQLINWSLSDNITRVILTYGVKLDSDPRLVQRLLQQAADENERVLHDPQPDIFFMRYTPNSMEFELRIFVNSLGDRLHATNELNGRVSELLAAHGLEIAFNQMDVWLHRADGARAKVSGGPPPTSEIPPPPPPGRAGDPGDIDIGGDGGGDGGR